MLSSAPAPQLPALDLGDFQFDALVMGSELPTCASTSGPGTADVDTSVVAVADYEMDGTVSGELSQHGPALDRYDASGHSTSEMGASRWNLAAIDPALLLEPLQAGAAHSPQFFRPPIVVAEPAPILRASVCLTSRLSLGAAWASLLNPRMSYMSASSGQSVSAQAGHFASRISYMSMSSGRPESRQDELLQ